MFFKQKKIQFFVTYSNSYFRYRICSELTPWKNSNKQIEPPKSLSTGRLAEFRSRYAKLPVGLLLFDYGA